MITLLVKSNKQLSMTKQTADVYSGESQFDSFKIMMSKTIEDKNTRDLITEFHLVYPNDEQDIVNIDFTEEDEKYLIAYLPIKKEYAQDLGSHFIYFKWLNTNGVVGVTNADLFIIKKHIDTAGVSEHQISILSEYSVKFAQWADSAKEDANKAKTYYTELIDHSGKLAPYIGENKKWFVYDSATDSHIDTGIPASGGTGDYNDLENLPTINNKEIKGNLTDEDLGLTKFVEKDEIAEVAKTGNYDDLNNKPTIPEKTSDLENDTGFITAEEAPSGTYIGNETPTDENVNYWINPDEEESSPLPTSYEINKSSTDNEYPTAKAVFKSIADKLDKATLENDVKAFIDKTYIESLIKDGDEVSY